MNKKIFLIIIPVLILIEFIFGFLLNNSFDKTVNKKVKENPEVNRQQFAIFIEDDNGNYNEYESSKLPANHVLNYEKSKCIDLKGNEIKDILSWDNNEVTVKITNTTFCYLYFELPPKAFAIYSNTDNSLSFYNNTNVENIKKGNVYNNKTVTEIYKTKDLNNTNFTSFNDVPWKDIQDLVKKVVVEESFSPVSTAYWFCDFSYANTFDLGKLDTSKVTNMSYMFAFVLSQIKNNTTPINEIVNYFLKIEFKYKDKLVINGIENWDTSQVKNMYRMFLFTGLNASSVEMDISKWDVSNVTNMGSMFGGFALGADEVNIGEDKFSKWNTSSLKVVTTMFYLTALNDKDFSMDLSNWDMSNVTDMRGMFNAFGYYSTLTSVKELLGDINNWDTSSVIDMSHVFHFTGNNLKEFSLDLTGWDVSNVKNMSSMFSSTGVYSQTIEIDISNWDTSNVTDMSYMFYGCGHRSTQKFSVDLTPKTVIRDDNSKYTSWNTKNVKNMEKMFRYSGHNSSEWEIGNLDNWDVSNVSNISHMFSGAGYNSINWNIGNISGWNVSEVTDMSYMFSNAGFNTTNWNVGDISKWNVSKVTDMSFAFEGVGKNAESISIGDFLGWKPLNLVDMSGMFRFFGNNSSEIDISSWEVGNLSYAPICFSTNSQTEIISPNFNDELQYKPLEFDIIDHYDNIIGKEIYKIECDKIDYPSCVYNNSCFFSECEEKNCEKVYNN